MISIPYQYHNLPIPGGGYVTGLLFHPSVEGLLYLRTDIGGTYRFDRKSMRWHSLISHVTMEDLSETFPISIAIDKKYPGRLYIACGINEKKSGVLAVSEDFGESFSYERIPVLIHGNLNGRGTGERLLVDEADSQRLYFASQQEGLWSSSDRGKSWRRLESLKEQYLTLIRQIVLPKAKLLIVGTAGVSTRLSENRRGHSMYISRDGGESFEELEEPESCEIPGCRLNGLVAQRCAVDGRYLYVTFASTGRRSYVLNDGYSCDSGDTIDGHLVRYALLSDGLGAMEDITLGLSGGVPAGICDRMETVTVDGQAHLECGISGISVSCQTPGMIVTSTIVKDNGDCIYRSLDYGKSWECILYDLEKNAIRFRAPYMKPQYNGGHSLIHWLSDFKINPYNDQEGWFNTGTGVFRTSNLREKDCFFTDWCDGIEETVHLNVYSLPKGPVKVLDILGDLGGFAFTDIEKPCENSFADEQGNRYITCINADYSDEDPSHIVVTPRGNWTGKTKGGLILSRDYGMSFQRLPMPFGLSPKLDQVLAAIETPNVNSGWAAISPDRHHIVWSVAKGIQLPADQVLVSHDGGESFSRCLVFDKRKRLIAGGEKSLEGEGELPRMKVFADRVNSNLFYGFGDHSRIYVSRDSGSSFYECIGTEKSGGTHNWLPDTEFGLIDCANRTEIRGDAGKSGVFYLALGEGGLWQAVWDNKEESWSFIRLSGEGDAVYRVGLGVKRPGGDYCREDKAIYCSARLCGEYGFYRSLDGGKNFERINNSDQMFGEIISIDGDSRVFGRFYLATGSRGLICGEPKY